MRTSCLLLAFALCSCADRVAPPVTAPPPVEKAAAVAPIASQARDQSEALRGQVSTLASTAAEARNQATAARVEAERLKDRQTATAAELESLWKSVQTVEARNLFLEARAKDLAASEEQLRATITTLEDAAAAKDLESEKLRLNESTLIARVNEANAAAATAYTARDKAEARALDAEEQAAKYKLIRNIALGAAAVFLAAWIAKLVRPV